MMTGFDREDTPLEALRLGAVDYMDKPITDANAFLRVLEAPGKLFIMPSSFALPKNGSRPFWSTSIPASLC